MPGKGRLSIQALAGQVQAVVVNEISRTALQILITGPQRIEVVLIVFLVVGAWAWLSGYLIVWIDSAAVLRQNERWRDLLKSVVSVLQMLGVFLVVQLLLSYMRTSVPSTSSGMAEALAGIFVLVIGATALVHTLKTIA